MNFNISYNSVEGVSACTKITAANLIGASFILPLAMSYAPLPFPTAFLVLVLYLMMSHARHWERDATLTDPDGIRMDWFRSGLYLWMPMACGVFSAILVATVI